MAAAGLLHAVAPSQAWGRWLFFARGGGGSGEVSGLSGTDPAPPSLDLDGASVAVLGQSAAALWHRRRVTAAKGARVAAACGRANVGTWWRSSPSLACGVAAPAGFGGRRGESAF